ncbi:MAG: hypothetical protein AAF791_01835 [Bacteroidota bacterium]
MLTLTRLSLALVLTLSACGSSRSSDPAPPSAPSTVLAATTATGEGCEEAAERYRDNDRVWRCEMRTLTLDGNRLSLDASPNGGVKVRPWNGSGIEIRARVETWGRTEAEADRALREVEIRAENASVRTERPDRDRDVWSSVHYEVFVPREADLDLQTVNGAISIAGVTGSTRLRSVNGGITLDQVGGRIEGETVNGPVRVALTEAPSKGVALSTVNGPLTLSVPGGISAEVDAETSIGPIRIDGLPLEDEGCEDRDERYGPCMNGRVVGTLGEGGPAFRLRTMNGPIVLERQ